MALNSIAPTPAAASSVSGEIGDSVLKSVLQLQSVLANELFASLGVGNTVDAFA
jgi:hypothetical protein